MSTVQFSLTIAEAGSTRAPRRPLARLNQSRTRSLLASLEMPATSTVLMMSEARVGKVEVQKIQKRVPCPSTKYRVVPAMIPGRTKIQVEMNSKSRSTRA